MYKYKTDKNMSNISLMYLEELRKLICQLQKGFNNDQNVNKEKMIAELEKNKNTAAILNENILFDKLKKLEDVMNVGNVDLNEFKDAMTEVEETLFTREMIYNGNGDCSVLVACCDNVLSMLLCTMLYENDFATGYVNDFDELLCVLETAYPDILMLDLDIIGDDDEKLSALSASNNSDTLLIAIASPNYLEYVNRYSRLFIWDYIIKPFNPKEVKCRVRLDMERFNYLKGQCLKDDLTGAYSRTYFMERLQQEYMHYCRNQQTFSLMFLDIDDFKKINDTYGHVFGDKVLKEFSSAIISSLRGNDIFCRYGGDEFAILLPDTNAENAKKVAQRMSELVSEIDIGYKISFSCGIKEIDSTVTSYEEVLEMADEAMYIAKNSGGNCIKVKSEVNGHTILVIDGSGELTDILRRSLLGVKIVLLHPENIAQIKDYNPSVILINDIHSSVDGKAILGELQRSIITSKIFYLTGEKDISSIRGADVVFSKPYSMTELEDEIYKFIGN